MGIGRRELLRLLGIAAGGAAMWEVSGRLAEAVVRDPRQLELVWLRGVGTEVSLLSQLGLRHPDFLQLVRLEWHLGGYDGLSGIRGEWDLEQLTQGLVLVLEGTPSEKELQGELWKRLLLRARTAILLGTDVCYGGVGESSVGLRLLERSLGDARVPVVKLPGVPPPPQHLPGVLAYMQELGFPRLDSHLRPLLYYGRTVCEDCERQGDLQRGKFARYLGDNGCLLQLGCKGPVTHNSCARQRWNGGEQWCVGVGGPCTGCSEPEFPYHNGLGLNGAIAATRVEGVSWWWRNMRQVGWGLLGLVGIGLGMQGLRGWLLPDRQNGNGKR